MFIIPSLLGRQRQIILHAHIQDIGRVSDGATNPVRRRGVRHGGPRRGEWAITIPILTPLGSIDPTTGVVQAHGISPSILHRLRNGPWNMSLAGGGKPTVRCTRPGSLPIRNANFPRGDTFFVEYILQRLKHADSNVCCLHSNFCQI